jgi:hypothetical protein
MGIKIAIAVPLLLFQFSSFAAVVPTCTDEATVSAFSIIPDDDRAKVVEIGDAVQIRLNESGEIKPAYFLGLSDSKAYFSPVTQASMRRPLFYLPKTSVNFIIEKNISGTESVVTALDAQEIPKLESSDDPDSCVPKTIMACLSHLDRNGLLSSIAKNTLSTHRLELFRELDTRLSRRVVLNSPEALNLLHIHDNAPNAKARKVAAENIRNFAFGRITLALSELGVSSQITTSYRALARHLRAGKPAYISVGARPFDVVQPSHDRWDDSIPWNDPDVQPGVFPTPTWAPAFNGFTSVYALAVLPRPPGVNGFLAGYRVVILTTETGTLNVWNTLALRFARSAKFILIGD